MKKIGNTYIYEPTPAGQVPPDYEKQAAGRQAPADAGAAGARRASHEPSLRSSRPRMVRLGPVSAGHCTVMPGRLRRDRGKPLRALGQSALGRGFMLTLE